MKAMILAAGLGTRLRPVTDHFAKPAVPFLNVPLLYYALALLEDAGANEFVINSHYQPEQIESLAREIPGGKGSPIISHEAGAPLGSGGGVWAAKRHLQNEDFFLANGDEVILPKDISVLKKLRAEHEQTGAIATIMVMSHPGVGTQFGGVWANANGDVAGFGKDSALFPNCQAYHYIGLQILSPRIFQYLKDGQSNILYDALASAIARGESVRIVRSDFVWFETGNPADFLSATHACLRLLRGVGNANHQSSPETNYLMKILERFWPKFSERASIWRGHGSEVSPSAIEGSASLLVGNGARVEAGAIVRGFSVLGDNSVIRSRALVENCVIFPGVHISSSASLKNQILTTSV